MGLGTSIRKIHVHVGINRHTRARTYSRQYIFSSVLTRALLCTHAHIILVSTFSHPYSHARTLVHTRTYYSRQHIFSSVQTSTRAQSRTRGVLGQGTSQWTHWAHCPKPH